MSLSSKTISAVQKAGSAASFADVELKKAASSYAARVNEAMLNNPFGANSDAVYGQWKTLARASQKLTEIEAELRRVYLVIADLVGQDDHAQSSAMRATAASTDEQRMDSQTFNSPTEVLVKSKNKTKTASAKNNSARQTKALVGKALSTPSQTLAPKLKTVEKKAKPKSRNVPPASTSVVPQVLTGNPAKLLNYLTTVLNADEFTAINQTAIAKVTSIPLGSLTAANKKLIQLGKLLPGPTGSFKLAGL